MYAANEPNKIWLSSQHHLLALYQSICSLNKTAVKLPIASKEL